MSRTTAAAVISLVPLVWLRLRIHSQRTRLLVIEHERCAHARRMVREAKQKEKYARKQYRKARRIAAARVGLGLRTR
jgi:hypothetical protein